MVRAAWDRVWPKVKAVAAEWWADIADKPRPHFVSMVFGMALYFAIKFAVWLVA